MRGTVNVYWLYPPATADVDLLHSPEVREPRDEPLMEEHDLLLLASFLFHIAYRPVPRHPREEQTHPAPVRDTGKDEPRSDQGRESE